MPTMPIDPILSSLCASPWGDHIPHGGCDHEDNPTFAQQSEEGRILLRSLFSNFVF